MIAGMLFALTAGFAFALGSIFSLWRSLATLEKRIIAMECRIDQMWPLKDYPTVDYTSWPGQQGKSQ